MSVYSWPFFKFGNNNKLTLLLPFLELYSSHIKVGFEMNCGF